MKLILRVARIVRLGVQHGPRMAGKLPQAWRVFRKAGWKGVVWELRRRVREPNNYEKWVAAFDTFTPQLRSLVEERVSEIKNPPLISIVMPTYNPSATHLRAAIDSVVAQLYPHWELCIADDASPNDEVRAILKEYADVDSRIKTIFRPQNGHISEASNSALGLASGQWIALMDHDDLLAEHALFWVADCIVNHPDVRLIYSDEDKIDDHGQLSDPYFKSDWNIDLFRSHNMFSHLGVLNADLVRSVGGFRKGLEGSQDWDLVIRCVEEVDALQIRHIPRVLYHWRVHEESTARSMDAKPYAALAGERVLNEHYQRTKVRAKAEFLGIGYRTKFALPDVLPLVSIIIPTRNGVELMRQCVDSIESKTDYKNYELLIVDNGSDEPAALNYFAMLAKKENVRVLRDERPFNYSALNNAAVEVAKGDVIALVNNDIEVISSGWLSEMVSLALQPGVGAVGARLWYPDMTLQHGGVVMGLGGLAAHAHKHLPAGLSGYAGRAVLAQSFSAVTAACLVVRKSIYQQAGGLDELSLPVAFNDIDFCLRLREAGYRNVWTPFAELLHHESATRGEDVAPDKRKRFEREIAYMQDRWAEVIAHDPAYSPNLTLDAENFSYAWPPRTEPI